MDLRTAERLLGRLPGGFGRRSAVQIGEAFVYGGEEMVNADGAPVRLPAGHSPLAALVSNEVAFKVYLTLVLMTKSSPHELFRPRVVAELAETLGYELLTAPDYTTGAGTRRVRRALGNLDKLGLINLDLDHGEYQVKVTHMPRPETPPFISIPTQLWANGWILHMKPPALAVYLFLRLLHARDGRAVAMGPLERARTGLSDDTFSRGSGQLVDHGILDRRKAVVTDRYGRRRVEARACMINDRRILDERWVDPKPDKSHWDQLWLADNA
mgnify:CR=1 FL=1